MTTASACFTKHYRTKKESPFHSVLNGTAPHQNFHPLGKFVPVKTLFDAYRSSVSGLGQLMNGTPLFFFFYLFD